MNSSVYDDMSSYVMSDPSFQNLSTYNQYGLNPKTTQLSMSIYPVYGGAGNTNLLHNLPRKDVNGCDYFSLQQAYPKPFPLSLIHI